jgi:hypothetical protein
MTASPVAPKAQLTLLSVALTVFVAHLGFCLLLWFSNDHGELDPGVMAALNILLFPVFIVFARPPEWPDAFMWCLLIVCWLLAGLFWSALIAGFVWFCRRVYAKVI